LINKAQIAAEPEVEDLLASIRKAITDEAGLHQTGAKSSQPAITGSMRELRVRTGDSAADNSREGEILELRNKISSQLGRKDKEEGRTETASPKPAATGFAGILGGGASRMTRPAASAQTRTAEPEHAPENLAPMAQPAYGAPEMREDPLQRYAEHQREWAAPPRYPPLADYRNERPNPYAGPSMMSQEAAQAAGSAFTRLADSLMARATGDRSIEELTKELLRSMLKQWLDEHLPVLVERLVREEIERVARRGPLR